MEVALASETLGALQWISIFFFFVFTFNYVFFAPGTQQIKAHDLKLPSNPFCKIKE